MRSLKYTAILMSIGVLLPTNNLIAMGEPCLIGSYAFCVTCCLVCDHYETEKNRLDNEHTFKALDARIETQETNLKNFFDVALPHLRRLYDNQKILARRANLALTTDTSSQQRQPPQLQVAIPSYKLSAAPTSLTPPPPPGAPCKLVPPPILYMNQLPTGAPDNQSFTQQKYAQSADSFSTSEYEECQ